MALDAASLSTALVHAYDQTWGGHMDPSHNPFAPELLSSRHFAGSNNDGESPHGQPAPSKKIKIE